MTIRTLSGKIQGGTPVEVTDRALTFYVRTTGNDTNNGLTVGNALLTVQAAIDLVPKYINHDVLVDIGVGTFGAFVMAGNTLETGGTYVVQGTMKTSDDLATGTATGTSDGGTTEYLDDSGQAWTVDDLKGRFLTVNGAPALIASNTATRIYVVARQGIDFNAKAYTIEDCATTINQTAEWGTAIRIREISGLGSGYYGPEIRRLKAHSTSAYGVNASYCEHIKLEILQVIDALYTAVSVSNCPNLHLFNVYAKDSTAGGFNIMYVKRITAMSALSTGDGSGFWFAHFFFSNCVNIDAGRLIAEDNGDGNGFDFVNCTWVTPERLTATGNNGHGLWLAKGTKMDKGGYADSNSLRGTGNGGFGVWVEVKSSAVFDGATTTMTGASGDATIDGSTVLDWTDDFGTDEDISTNLTYGTHIERRDVQP